MPSARSLLAHQTALSEALTQWHSFWHPQPFRDDPPAWVVAEPRLATALRALSDHDTEHLNDDADAAQAWLASFLPDIVQLRPLTVLNTLARSSVTVSRTAWDWEVPGRKQAQIQAFVESIPKSDQPVLDWCGGKGHLGRLLALHWQQSVTSLDIDPELCRMGALLASRLGASQTFVTADALSVEDWPRPGVHAVALHACGDLHRRLINTAVCRGVRALDVAPCCYYRGVTDFYQPLSPGAGLVLTRDDVRLAVTETVTASPRLRRQRDQSLAWKLGFSAYRGAVIGNAAYRTFKPVPERWLRASFSEFLAQMAIRENLPPPAIDQAATWERQGWAGQRRLMRLSIVRHAFRRALEVWLVLDLARALEQHGFDIQWGAFCARHLTPRNLLISARR